MNSPEGEMHDNRFKTRLFSESFLRRTTEIPPGAVGSVQWLGEVGSYWKNVRKDSGLLREDVANRLGATPDFLSFFERGIFDPEVARGDLPLRLADALGNPELYKQYCERFEITPYNPEPDTGEQTI